MKPSTTEDVLDVLESSCAAAAVGAAMELGLFWLIKDRPHSLEHISQTLGVPLNRCQYWLQLLGDLGLIERGTDGYQPSATAKKAVLGAYNQDSWALLAQEARERAPALLNLALRLRKTGPAPSGQEAAEEDYVTTMSESPEKARRFTRMLYEIHKPLSEIIPQALDMSGVDRMMDLGGGSGVVSLGLLRQHPQLTAVVVDVAPVCYAGREIAKENSLEERISYHPANFLEDELPSGFDMVLECDVNVYGESLFRKIYPEGPFPTPKVGSSRYTRNLAIVVARK
jgi:hypothetical protein